MTRDLLTEHWRSGANTPEAIRAEEGWRRRIGLMRALLPIAALGVVAALVAWPMANGIRDQVGMDLTTSDLAAVDRDEAMNPHFTSIDSSRRPYTVDAKSAWRPSTGGERVFLVEPRARFTTGSGWMTVAAMEGIFDRDRETLQLSGGVDVQTESGLELRTESASFDMRAGLAETEDPVSGRGPWGRLDSTGCSWSSERGMLRCGGRPTLVLYLAAFEGEGES